MSEKTEKTEKTEKAEKPTKIRGIQTFKVHLVGKKPLLMNAMSAETLEILYDPSSKGPRVNMPKEEKAALALYRDDDGKVGMPSVNLLAALRAAGRKVKVGKNQISNAKATMLYSFLDIVDNFVILTGMSDTQNKEGWVVDMRRGRLPLNGTAVCLVRPKFPTWELEFEVEVDLDIVTIDTVRALFEQAGRTSGLGDFRPSCNGPFGQFTLAALEQIQALEKAKAA